MIIAVLNQKGGVGKTTTTVNLGAALTETGARVLLVDLDPQKSLSTFQMPEGGPLTIAVATPDTLESVLASHAFDHAILDCPPLLDRASASALKVAKLAIAPTPPRFLDVAGFALLRRSVEEAASRANAGLRLKILITLREARALVHQDYEEKLRRTFRDEVFQSVIPRSVVFDRAADARVSVLQLEPRSVGARAYQSLAREILQLNEETAAKPIAPKTKPRPQAKPKL